MNFHNAYNMRNNAHSSSAILPTDYKGDFAYKKPMQYNRDITIEAVKAMVKRSRLSKSALAAKARMSPSTINRKLAGTDPTGFTHLKLTALARAAGYDSYEHFVVEWFTTDAVIKEIYKIRDTIDKSLLREFKQKTESAIIVELPKKH